MPDEFKIIKPILILYKRAPNITIYYLVIKIFRIVNWIEFTKFNFLDRSKYKAIL